MTISTAPPPAEPSECLPGATPTPPDHDRSAAPAVSPTEPHLGASGGRVGPLHYRAVTFRGALHAALGEDRQDALGIADRDPLLVLGVADGVGSCSHSGPGARAAVDAAVVRLRAAAGLDDAPSGSELVDLVAAAVTEQAAGLGVAVAQVATTLTIAAVDPLAGPDGSHQARIWAVGDSPAFLVSTDRTWTELTPPSSRSNILGAHLPARADDPVELAVALPAGSILVLASDGFSVPLDDGTEGLGPSLAARWLGAPRSLLPFVVDLSFEGYHDDRTVAAVWIPERPDPGPADGTPPAAERNAASDGEHPAVTGADPTTADQADVADATDAP